MKETKNLKIGYEKATFEKDGKTTEYEKYYIELNGYKHYIKIYEKLSKQMIKEYLDKE